MEPSHNGTETSKTVSQKKSLSPDVYFSGLFVIDQTPIMCLLLLNPQKCYVRTMKKYGWAKTALLASKACKIICKLTNGTPSLPSTHYEPETI